MDALVVIVFVLIVVAVVAIRMMVAKRETKRSDAFAGIAEELGMEYSKSVDKTFLNGLKQFRRFETNRQRRVNARNVITMKHHDMLVVFFECPYVSRSSSNKTSGQSGQIQSIFYFQSPKLNLPRFTLQTMNGMAQSFLGLFGIEDIDFSNHPEFSQKYLLNGPDPIKIKNLFNDTLLNHLVNVNGLDIEGSEDTLIIYPSADQDPFADNHIPYTRLDPQNFKKQQELALQVCKLFC